MDRRTIEINGIELSYVEAGTGPLALLLHGFPESGETTYRHLVPALAEAGYRAVAPNMRGFAPSGVPVGGELLLEDLVADVAELHEQLGGGSDAVVIGHDWGAATAWATAAQEPDRWHRVVTSDVPPLEFFGEYAATYEGIEALNHFWFFQMRMADQVLAAEDFAYLGELMQRRWTGPGYDATPDIDGMKRALGEPGRLELALSLYRANFPTDGMGGEQWAARQFALWGALPTQPTLYLHGTHDTSVRMTPEMLKRIEAALAPGSRAELIEGAGHLVPAERPDDYNARVLAFLAGR